MPHKEMKTESSMQERFDNKFCILMYGKDIPTYKNLGLLNEIACERLKIMNPTRLKPVPPSADDIKSFIQSEIELAVKKRDEEIVDMIENHTIHLEYGNERHRIFAKGYTQARNDFINLITKQ